MRLLHAHGPALIAGGICDGPHAWQARYRRDAGTPPGGAYRQVLKQDARQKQQRLQTTGAIEVAFTCTALTVQAMVLALQCGKYVSRGASVGGCGDRIHPVVRRVH